MKSLYVHIPFCKSKCLYCDFNSYVNENLQDEYVASLLKEINSIKKDKFETIFIGGGTPTILSIKNLEIILKSLERFKPYEFTVECNPGTITEEKLLIMKKYGVNRLSIGLQATQNKILKSLGRIHTYNEFLSGYNLARSLGFNNINIDLMFAVPNQSFEDFKESLEVVTSLNPTHISTYSLIIEENTPFYSMENEGKLSRVDEDVESKMYDFSIEYLRAKGYKWYEISNFAKDNMECEHNKTYWKCNEYLGVGSGAHSYINHSRFYNYPSIKGYIDALKNGSPIEESEKLTQKDEMEEFMFLGLRMIDGIDKNEFEKRFNLSIEAVYKDQLETLKNKGLICEENDKIRLTKKGINISNSVFVEFMN